MNRRNPWIGPAIVMVMMGFLVLAIVGIAVSGSHASAQAAEARVHACAKVKPAQGRGACVNGKPATVSVVKTVTVYRAPTYTIDGLIERCINLATQDQKNTESAINGDNVPAGDYGSSTASGLGTCLTGVGTLNDELPQK